MAEEQFNMMDDWFREAAAQDGPPPAAEAWEKMNALLDAEEKKRRRFFFWWWLPVLLGVAGLLTYQAFRNPARTHTDPQPTKANHAPATAEHTAEETGDPASGILVSPAVKFHQNPAGNTSPGKTIKNLTHRKREKKFSQQLPNENPQPKIHTLPDLNPHPQQQTEIPGNTTTLQHNNTTTLQHGTITTLQPNTNTTQPTNTTTSSQPNTNTTRHTNINTTLQHNTNTTLQPDSATTRHSEPEPEPNPEPVKNPLQQDSSVTKALAKKQDDITQRFYLYAGAAPEFSFTSGSQAGKTTLAWGGGLGFQPAKKLSIQTGFFITKKIYSATGNAYTPKPGSYYDNENYKIKNVDADCSILEIPVQVRYDFLQQKKQSFFVMAGLTSTIMKEEYYSYDYTRYGQQAYYSHTYSTGSFKLFSGAGISIGLERKIAGNFFLMLAPYYNFPLRGVGEGSVKLNAAGILTGLRYQLPFPKK